MFDWAVTLWNGGLDPETADPRQLRARRTVSSVSLMLMPLGGAMIAIDLAYNNLGDLPWVIAAMLVIVLSLFAQVRWGHPERIGQVAIAAFWSAPTLAMSDTGPNGIAWVWLSATPVVATLLGGRLSGVVWTGVGLAALWGYGAAEVLGVEFSKPRMDFALLPVLIEGSLIQVFLSITTQAFAGAQAKAQAEAYDLVDQLQREVEIRRAAEARAMAAAEQAQQGERAKAAFLATMSHEIRTPMNGVLGAAELLSRSPLSEEQRALLETVESSGELLLSLIDDILDFSRLEDGRLVLELCPVAARDLLQTTVAPLRFSATAKGVELVSEVSDAVPAWVKGDPTRLRQILLNLVGNAIKFTERGTVRVRFDVVGQRLQIEVADTGIGMAAEVQSTLFEPFVQAEASTTRRFGGSGLGLAIVRRLVEAMGGQVRLESSVGVGTTFWVELPLEAVDPPTTGGVKAVRPEAAEGLIVLLVDDNHVNRVVARTMLLRLGHSVIEAEDGQQALDAALDKAPDVVLMDVQMPVMDGLEATRRIRQLAGEAGRVPIVGLTANALPRDREAVLDAGMDEHLPKPVRLEGLRDALSRAAQTTAMRRRQAS